LKAAAMEIGHG